MQYTVSFPGGAVEYIFHRPFSEVMEAYTPANCVLLMDNNIAAIYLGFFEGYRTVIIPAGEDQKTWQTVAAVTDTLLRYEAHRNTILIGIGGGVVTDITGLLAAVYMRGIPCGYVPTTLLGMVDAAVGGKNGVNAGLHKNIIGTIRQPSFLLFDTAFLRTLPDEEWSNGFAEVIKYACVFDKQLFDELDEHNITFYKNDPAMLQALIVRCVDMKNKVVLADENENGDRKLLNFGHTAAHALEQLYNLPHGQAVAIGMIVACRLSEAVMALPATVGERLRLLLQKYGLPHVMSFDAAKVMDILKMDKKRNNTGIDYILLKHIGQPVISHLSFDVIFHSLSAIADAGDR